MSKKALVSAYVGYQNFGDEAIFAVLASKLKSLGFEVTALSGHPEKTAEQYDVAAIYNFNLLFLINAVKNTDVLISGGGSILQDATSLKSLLYYLFVLFLGKFFKKKVIVFAQGIGPINSKIGRFFTRKLLEKCDFVSVRDILSQRILKRWNIPSEYIPDPFWDIELPPCTNEHKVGIQLRHCKGLSDDFLKVLAGEVIRNFSDRKIEIYSLHDKYDLPVCVKFRNMLKSREPSIKCEIFHSLNVEQTIEKFAKLEFLVAMRFHACVLGIKTGIKTLCISYDPKVKTLCQDAKIPYLDLNDYDDISSYFGLLKRIVPETLLKFAGGKKLNWSEFEKCINS